MARTSYAEKRAAAARERYDTAKDALIRILADVVNVYSVLTWINREGDRRSIKVLIPATETRFDRQAPAVMQISHHVADLGLGNLDRIHGGVCIEGGGMDMGESLWHSIARHLGPWKCHGEGCMSDAHWGDDAIPWDGITMHTDTARFSHRWL